MKPVVQRDKNKRSVRIMFTSHSYSGLQEEMSFVQKALVVDRNLEVLRKKVEYLRKETQDGGNRARKWYKSSIENANKTLASLEETKGTFGRQLESDSATRKFLKETLLSSEVSLSDLNKSNKAMLDKSRDDIREKERQLKLAEEAKVGQQKKLHEVNQHLKILLTTARTMQENVTKLQAQRDQLKAKLQDSIDNI